MKNYLDLAVSTAIMIVVSPVLIGLTLVGALSSGDPIIYGQSQESTNSICKLPSKPEKAPAQQVA